MKANEVTTKRAVVSVYDARGMMIGSQQVSIDVAGGPTVVHYEGVAHYYTGKRTQHGYAAYASVKGIQIWFSEAAGTLQVCGARQPTPVGDLQGMNGEGI